MFVSNNLQGLKVLGSPKFNTFENIAVQFKANNRQNLTLIVVYRPPETNKATFVNEFFEYLDNLDCDTKQVFICGDFNLWIDDENDRHAREFMDSMDSRQFSNKVNEVTSRSGHMLDLIFCDGDRDVLRNLVVEPDFSVSPYHKLITYNIFIQRVIKTKKTISFRDKRYFDGNIFLNRVLDEIAVEVLDTCDHMNDVDDIPKGECLECMVSVYKHVLESEYNTMCPVIQKDIIEKDNTPWFNAAVANAIKLRRKKERRWRSLRTVESRRDYVTARNEVNKLIRKTKCMYYRRRIAETGPDTKRLYFLLNSLTGNIKKEKFPEGFTDLNLANEFMRFFDNKVKNIVNSFQDVGPGVVHRYLPDTPRIGLTSFNTINREHLQVLLKRLNKTYCRTDPIPIGCIADSDYFTSLSDVILTIVNLSTYYYLIVHFLRLKSWL